MLRSILSIVVLGLCSGIAAMSQQVRWEQTFGGDDLDIFNDLIATTDGGFVALGQSDSYAGSSRALLVKVDSNGVKLWEQVLGGPALTVGAAVVEASDGGFVVTGFYTPDDSVGREVIVIGTDADGKERWRQTYGDSLNNAGTTIISMAEGGYLIAAFSGQYSSQSSLYLLRLNDDGESLWERTIVQMPGDVFINRLIELDDGSIVGVGSHTTYHGGSVTYSRPLVLRIGGNGDLLSVSIPNGTLRIDATSGLSSMAQTADGGFLLLGGINRQQDNLNAVGILLLKVDSLLNVEWDRELDVSEYRDSGSDIMRTGTDEFVIAANVNIDRNLPGANGDVMLLGINTAGDTLWSWRSTGRCLAVSSLVSASDGGFVIAGHSSCTSSSRDAMVMKIARSLSSSVETPGANEWRGRPMNLK